MFDMPTVPFTQPDPRPHVKFVIPATSTDLSRDVLLHLVTVRELKFTLL